MSNEATIYSAGCMEPDSWHLSKKGKPTQKYIIQRNESKIKNGKYAQAKRVVIGFFWHAELDWLSE